MLCCLVCGCLRFLTGPLLPTEEFESEADVREFVLTKVKSLVATKAQGPGHLVADGDMVRASPPAIANDARTNSTSRLVAPLLLTLTAQVPERAAGVSSHLSDARTGKARQLLVQLFARVLPPAHNNQQR